MSDYRMRQMEIERAIDEAANHVKDIRAAAKNEFDVRIITTCMRDIRMMQADIAYITDLLKDAK